MEGVLHKALGGIHLLRVPAEGDPSIGVRNAIKYLSGRAAEAQADGDSIKAAAYRSVVRELQEEFIG